MNDIYQTKRLVDAGFDFAAVFPEKQQYVQDTENFEFRMPEIVSFLQQQTDNFKIENPVALDVDRAIVNVITRWSEQAGVPNPLTPDVEVVEEMPIAAPAEVIEEVSGEIPEAQQTWIEGIETLNELIAEEDAEETYGAETVENWKEAVETYTELLEDMGIKEVDGVFKMVMRDGGEIRENDEVVHSNYSPKSNYYVRELVENDEYGQQYLIEEVKDGVSLGKQYLSRSGWSKKMADGGSTYSGGGTVIKKGNKVRVVNTQFDGQEGLVMSNDLVDGKYIVQMSDGSMKGFPFENLMLLSRDTYSEGGEIKVGDTVYPESLSGKWTVVSVGEKKSNKGKMFMGSEYYETVIENEKGERQNYPSNRFENGGSPLKYFIDDEGMFKGGEYRIKSHTNNPNTYYIQELDEDGNPMGDEHRVNQKDFEANFSKFEDGGVLRVSSFEDGGEVAQEIYRQLGGNRFVVMTGAKNFVQSAKDKWLSFRIGRNKSKANYVKIQLNSMDTYDMTFGRIHGGDYRDLKTFNGIYGDQLEEIFQDYTGLYTRLKEGGETEEDDTFLSFHTNTVDCNKELSRLRKDGIKCEKRTLGRGHHEIHRID